MKTLASVTVLLALCRIAAAQTYSIPEGTTVSNVEAWTYDNLAGSDGSTGRLAAGGYWTQFVYETPAGKAQYCNGRRSGLRPGLPAVLTPGTRSTL